jgi:hypothetical protein
MDSNPATTDNEKKIYIEQLKNAVTLSANEDRISWTIFSVFFGSQGVLIGGFFRNGGFIESAIAGFLLAFFGLIVSWVWWNIQMRALGHLNRFDELVTKLENKLEIPNDLAISRSKNEGDYKKFVTEGIRARFLIPWTCRAFVLLWSLIAFGYLAYAIIHHLILLCGC